MRILILGSEGFIGKHAVAYFKAAGHQVISADIILKEEENYLTINPELPDFSTIFRKQEFDACINATGAANVQLSLAYPGMDYDLNTVNVYHILDGIRQHNNRTKFINLSSAAVYGNPVSLPIKETHAVQPLSPYGFHKWYSEQVCKQFYLLYGIQTLSLRIFSAYGEGLRKQLFWDVYQKIKNSDGTIELFGTGKESRDFIHVQDIMQALDSILMKKAFNGEVINVASGDESTIERVVSTFIEASGKNVKLKFKGTAKEGDPLNWRADISTLKSLGFKQKVSLEEGIKRYAAWVQQFSNL